MNSFERNKKTTVVAIFLLASAFTWSVVLRYDDPILSEFVGHILGGALTLMIPALYWALTFAIRAARDQDRPDNSLTMAVAFIGASLILGMAPSMASGIFWPLAIATVLGAIFSIGPISILNRTEIKDENIPKNDQNKDGPD